MFGDNATKILTNCSALADDSLGELLEYISNHQVSGPLTQEIEAALTCAKNSKEWRMEFMTMQMKLAEERRAGIAIGQEQQLLSIVSKHVRAGRTIPEIATAICETVEETEKLVAQVKEKGMLDS